MGCRQGKQPSSTDEAAITHDGHHCSLENCDVFLPQVHYEKGLARMKSPSRMLDDTSMLLIMMAICMSAQANGNRYWYIEPLALNW